MNKRKKALSKSANLKKPNGFVCIDVKQVSTAVRKAIYDTLRANEGLS